MRTFEAELNRAVADFVSRLAELGRLGAYAMVVRALERDTSVIDPTPARRRKRESDALRLGLRKSLRHFERQCIDEALQKHDGNVTAAAKALRVSRQSLQRKMRRLALSHR